MMFRLLRFNIILTVLVCISLCTACQTEERKKKKTAAMISLHMEVSPFEKEQSETISMPRDNPFNINITKESFLNESDLSDAKVIEGKGGFAISLRFDRRGQWLLEQYTSVNKGRRVVIECAFGPKLKEKRWIAAPVITRHVSDGILTFTPDATREEAEEMVLGLNNVAKKIQNKSSFF
jgi:hypothetical protein